MFLDTLTCETLAIGIVPKSCMHPNILLMFCSDGRMDSWILSTGETERQNPQHVPLRDRKSDESIHGRGTTHTGRETLECR